MPGNGRSVPFKKGSTDTEQIRSFFGGEWSVIHLFFLKGGICIQESSGLLDQSWPASIIGYEVKSTDQVKSLVRTKLLYVGIIGSRYRIESTI